MKIKTPKKKGYIQELTPIKRTGASCFEAMKLKKENIQDLIEKTLDTPPLTIIRNEQ